MALASQGGPKWGPADVDKVATAIAQSLPSIAIDQVKQGTFPGAPLIGVQDPTTACCVDI
eukprot:15455397-Alexandrium_andersonii.AAC.1